MASIIGFIATVFWLALGLLIVLGALALTSYNKLQNMGQDVKEKSSNVQVSVTKKIQLVNQLGDIVRSYQSHEKLTQLTVSSNNTTRSVSGAYQESGRVLATIQSMASQFPDLKANTQYHRLIDSIQNCESDIENRRNSYNNSVKQYNGVRSAIPTVFIARAIGFSEAPFLQFDVDGVEDTTLRRFETPDGQHLENLLGSARDRVVGGVKLLSATAGELGGAAIARTRGTLPRTSYFYATHGGVPKGPHSIAEIERLVAEGSIPSDVQIAEQGGDHWRSLATVADRRQDA